MDIYSLYYLLVFNNRQKGLPHSLFFFFCWILGPFGAPVLFLYGAVLTMHHLILVGHMPNNHKSTRHGNLKEVTIEVMRISPCATKDYLTCCNSKSKHLDRTRIHIHMYLNSSEKCIYLSICFCLLPKL